jgi:hypothetical protein
MSEGQSIIYMYIQYWDINTQYLMWHMFPRPKWWEGGRFGILLTRVPYVVHWTAHDNISGNIIKLPMVNTLVQINLDISFFLNVSRKYLNRHQGRQLHNHLVMFIPPNTPRSGLTSRKASAERWSLNKLINNTNNLSKREKLGDVRDQFRNELYLTSFVTC